MVTQEMKPSINLQDYFPLIQKIISKFPREHSEDLFNECFIQLHDMQDGFDASLGSFTTYAYKRLYFRCQDYIFRYSAETQSLDCFIINEDDTIRKVELLEDELDLEASIIQMDSLATHQQGLSEVERFIQNKYYLDGTSVANIIKVYQPYHLIRSESTIRKILKK